MMVVNAGYGSLGAGRLSLWGDTAAADRAVLETVASGLRGEGLTLTEADTDGVHFSVPEGWVEARERALIVGVGAGLPAGVTPEHHGCWTPMLSHETRN